MAGEEEGVGLLLSVSLLPSVSQLPEPEARAFSRLLADWYRMHARVLPWRGIADPYRTWVSEVMLQQTRVAAVIEHYERFIVLFPDVVRLGLAPEDAVLAAWSGLGYYRRARMLHKAAQFLVVNHGGKLPSTATELRTLPGIGSYTAAAIASIAFGERVAVVDGNVERVLLRVLGRGEEASPAQQRELETQATALLAATAGSGRGSRVGAGDHNQAMMELGATVCLPRGPLCLQCPVYRICRTRGEHRTLPRNAQRSLPAAYLLATRKRGVATELLLHRRATDAALMAGMYELPPLPLDAVEGLEPLLRVRHSITNTNWYVAVYGETRPHDRALRRAIPATKADLLWHPLRRLGDLPLTGLARKAVMRLRLHAVDGPQTPEQL